MPAPRSHGGRIRGQLARQKPGRRDRVLLSALAQIRDLLGKVPAEGPGAGYVGAAYNIAKTAHAKAKGEGEP